MNPTFAKFLTSPLVGALDGIRGRDRREERVYGGDIWEPSPAVLLIILIAFLSAFILWIMGMLKAFKCGTRTTNLGGTGSTWGLVILIFGLVTGPVGILLALIFLVAGGCQKIH